MKTAFNENKNLLEKNFAAVTFVLFDKRDIDESQAATVLTGEFLFIKN